MSVRDKAIKAVCDHYSCSDGEDNMYPECTLWKVGDCPQGDLVDKILALPGVYTEDSVIGVAEEDCPECFGTDKCYTGTGRIIRCRYCEGGKINRPATIRDFMQGKNVRRVK